MVKFSEVRKTSKASKYVCYWWRSPWETAEHWQVFMYTYSKVETVY